MSNKPRISLLLFHRDRLSLGPSNREKYGQAIYHWALCIRPKSLKRVSESTTYDVTDGFLPTPGSSSSPKEEEGSWRFRIRASENPFSTGRCLVGVVIGKLPKEFTGERVEEILRGLDLPRKGVEGENCVSWVRRAVERLQEVGGLGEGDVDVERMMGWAMGEGDRVMKEALPEKEGERWVEFGGGG